MILLKDYANQVLYGCLSSAFSNSTFVVINDKIFCCSCFAPPRLLRVTATTPLVTPLFSSNPFRQDSLLSGAYFLNKSVFVFSSFSHFFILPPVGLQGIMTSVSVYLPVRVFVCLFVCLSARISQEPQS